MSSPMGYSGFENPMEWYYGTSPSLPVLFTGAYQVRQVGAGSASTFGQPKNIIPALANPTAHMVTANNDSITHATALYTVTAGDIFNYSPASATTVTGGTP